MPGDFFDTNVLLYTASADARKADRAEALLHAGGAISVQVLNEAANVARRKMRLEWSELHALLSGWRGLLSVHPLQVADHDLGLALAERYRLSVFDGLIVASALNAGGDRLWSEDLHDGLLVNGRLRVVNPFK